MFTFEEMSDNFWLMLGQVGIYQNEEETCVKELSKEHTICDGGESLTVSIFTYPSDEANYDFLENCVESNDDNSNQK